MAAATRVVEMVCPGTFLEFWGLVLNKPLQHAHGFVSIIAVASERIHLQVARGHVAAAFCRRQRFDAYQWTQVDWGLSNSLLQEPLEEFDSKRQGPQRGGQAVERFVRFIVVGFDPPFDSLQGFMDRSAFGA
jgi:hypothetical protein